MNDDPVEQGKLAAANGDPLSANPYPEDAEEYEEWAEGWHSYHEVNDEGEPLDDA